jgi:hypothetical protein
MIKKKDKETKGELSADPKAAFKIEGTDAVGAVAGAQLRNQAIAVTLASPRSSWSRATISRCSVTKACGVMPVVARNDRAK